MKSFVESCFTSMDIQSLALQKAEWCNLLTILRVCAHFISTTLDNIAALATEVETQHSPLQWQKSWNCISFRNLEEPLIYTSGKINYDVSCIRLFLVVHRGQKSKQMNIAKYISEFLICGAKILEKCVKSQKKILYIILSCKVKLSKMASIKTNKIKKQTALS